MLNHLHGIERSSTGYADSTAAMQRRTARRFCRVYPSASRVASSNLDPLPIWRAGAQFVALNLQTVDLSTQLHYALFELGGGSGYVLKPPEMRVGASPKSGGDRPDAAARTTDPHLPRASSPSDLHLEREVSEGSPRGTPSRRSPATVPAGDEPAPWPPIRSTIRRASIRVLQLHYLPTRHESRPKLMGGPHQKALEWVPELNGTRAPPESGAPPANPAVRLSLHSIGGVCRVSPSNPPAEDAGNVFTSSAAIANGLNPRFDSLVHCFAAEPRETILKIAIIDNDAEVAFETMSLGLLRPGYRCVQLRMLTGTRIRLCTLLVHVELSDEINLYAERRSLLEVISQREKVIREQRDRISRLEAGLVSEYQTNEACIEVDATKVRLRP